MMITVVFERQSVSKTRACEALVYLRKFLIFLRDFDNEGDISVFAC